MKKVLVFMILLFSTSGVAYADVPPGTTYGLSYINSWDGCDCRSNRLRYTDDQINQLDRQLRLSKMTKYFKFSDKQVWASDIIDSEYGGGDGIYADAVDLYALSSHGGSFKHNNQEEYVGVYCQYGYQGYSSFYETTKAKCYADSYKMRFGNYDINQRFGKLRWLILATCYSVHEHPMEQWKRAFAYGLDFVLGYRGTSSDSEFTDENLADFARHAFRGNSKFKQVWFSANEDWWVDDTASLMTCSSQNISDTSSTRLNNYRKTWTARKHDNSPMSCCWSWHKG